METHRKALSNLPDRALEFEKRCKDETAERIKARQRRRASKLCLQAVERVIPKFLKFQIVPEDIREIFSPVQFVAFDGLSESSLERVCLIDSPAENKAQEKMQKSVEKDVKRGNYDGSLLRVDQEGNVAKENSA